MNVYMPPQRRETIQARRDIRQHVRHYLQSRDVDVISRPGGGRSLPWLKRAGGLVLETNVITEADEAECLYVAEELGRQVLVLYDTQNSLPGTGPSEQLVAASRRDGNENANLWVVRHSPLALSDSPYAIIDSALAIYTRVDLASDS